MGIWGVLESELELLSGIEGGHDAIELGCGTAEISAWLARRGARPVAVDLSSRQIRNVETLQREYQLSFPLVVGNAEAVHYEDASFDVAISEYGASLWCDPQRSLPEAYRLLRPGAVLIFITNSDFLMVCTPPGGGQAADRLMRDFFSQSRMEFEDGGPVEFHPTHGSWIRLLRKTGFVVEGLIEVRPPPDASPRYDFVTLSGRATGRAKRSGSPANPPDRSSRRAAPQGLSRAARYGGKPPGRLESASPGADSDSSDRLDRAHDVETDGAGGPKRRPVEDRRAEVRDLERERLGRVDAGRHDVARPIGELIIAEALRIRKGRPGVEDAHGLRARVVVHDHLRGSDDRRPSELAGREPGKL